MPPCPAPQQMMSNDVATKPSSNGPKIEMPPKPVRQHKTFPALHWGMNVISFSSLGALYYLIPEDYKNYMHVIFGLIVIDASRYYYMKGAMAGVPYTLPFVTLFAMLAFPVTFWGEMAHIAMASADGLCTNLLLGNFLVFCTEPDLCREVLTGEGTYMIYAHPNAKWLFGEKNLIYLDTEPHKAVRKILSPALFTGDALESYAQLQEEVLRKYLAKYAKQCKETGKPIDLRVAFRSMAAAASQESFLGPYLTDELRVSLEEDILGFTLGFLNVPFPYAGGLARAIEAKNRIEGHVQHMIPKARKYVAEGNAPRCLLERWFVHIIDAAKDLGVDSENVPCCADDDVARCVLDFLFAAQDATNSALTYGVDILTSRPDVMDKLQEEVEGVVGKDGQGVWNKFREPSALPYASKVANQILHHKPPVPMIPHLSLKSSHLAGNHVPKGTVVIPSLSYAARMNGVCDEFIPDRPDQDSQFVKCMTFGGGQHKCPGRKYAEQLLAVFVAVVSTDYRFERVGERPGEDEFIYFPTLFPSENDFMVYPLD